MPVRTRALRAVRFPAAVALVAAGLLLALHPAGCSEDAECSSNADCDDGVFCNGAETCGRTGRCFPAVSAPCDDGLACNTDTCVEADGSCAHHALDLDGDTYEDADCGGDDCIDFDADVHPGATETCNGLDDDCDGTVAEDRDGDRHLDSTLCPTGDDCDDTDRDVYAGAPEICDGKDNDCDGSTADERDTDGDTAVDSTCAGGTDCDDEDPARHPGAREVCNDVDDDCDDRTDEVVGSCRIGETVRCLTSCGSVGSGRCTDECRPPAAASCDRPEEICHNRIDDDCNGETDERCSSTECVATGDECCGDGIDDNCDTRTDEFGCTPHGACPPRSGRSCSTGGEWGYQLCPVSGLAWGPCFVDAAPPGCPSSPEPGWDPVCCRNSGFCCQDTADADGDGYTSDSVGHPGACPPESNCQ